MKEPVKMGCFDWLMLSLKSRRRREKKKSEENAPVLMKVVDVDKT